MVVCALYQTRFVAPPSALSVSTEICKQILREVFPFIKQHIQTEGKAQGKKQ